MDEGTKKMRLNLVAQWINLSFNGFCTRNKFNASQMA